MNAKRIENAKKLHTDILTYLRKNDFEIEWDDVDFLYDWMWGAGTARRVRSFSSSKTVRIANIEFTLLLDAGINLEGFFDIDVRLDCNEFGLYDILHNTLTQIETLDEVKELLEDTETVEICTNIKIGITGALLKENLADAGSLRDAMSLTCSDFDTENIMYSIVRVNLKEHFFTN